MLFISQLQTNLLNKYIEKNNNKNRNKNSNFTAARKQDHDYGYEAEDSNSIKNEATELSIFQEFKFKKQISTRIVMKGQEQIVVTVNYSLARL